MEALYRPLLRRAALAVRALVVDSGVQQLTPAELREWIDERAAILEYDGGLNRTEAELLARKLAAKLENHT